jgi:hypothetical protein
MKSIITILVGIGMILTGCVTTSKYKVGEKVPPERPLFRCVSVTDPQSFEWEDLEIFVEPDDTLTKLLITVNKPASSKIKTIAPGEIKIDIVYFNKDREIIHVIHKIKSVFGYPVHFSDPMPTNLDVKYITAGYMLAAP